MNEPAAYMVAATFGSGSDKRILLNAVISPSPEAASAMAVFAFVKEIGTEHVLTGINVQKLEPEFMRIALNPDGGSVVPLRTVGQHNIPADAISIAQQPLTPNDEPGPGPGSAA